MPERNARDAALDCFARGFNCAEATLMGLAEAVGIEGGCAPRVATGFGGGIGGCGEICGALTGAVMAFGLKYGRERPEDVDSKTLVAGKVERLFEEFEKEFGKVRCIDLTECDMRTPEGKARAKELNLHGKVCPAFVAFAAERAALLLEQ